MAEHLLYAAGAGFEAARQLPASANPALRRLHGHSFAARVRVLPPAAGLACPGSFAGGEAAALQDRLRAVLRELDYSSLNALLPQPDDESLARWIHARLALPGTALVGLASTPAGGIDLDAQGIAHVWRRYEFASAHCLPHVPAGHKCGRMHGHGFAVLVHVRAADATPGSTPDPAVLDAAWAPLQQRLHHACLNDIAGLENPTSECLSSWLWEQLQPGLPQLHRVSVFETATCGAHFDGSRYRIWKDLDFDSAIRLAAAPAGDARRGVHGHSYRLRLHLSAPLDTLRGWTIDFGDVKELFNPVYARLDHHPLHELAGIAEGGSAALLQWVRAQAGSGLPALERIDLFETADCGALLCWGPQAPAFSV